MHLEPLCDTSTWSHLAPGLGICSNSFTNSADRKEPLVPGLSQCCSGKGFLSQQWFPVQLVKLPLRLSEVKKPVSKCPLMDTNSTDQIKICALQFCFGNLTSEFRRLWTLGSHKLSSNSNSADYQPGSWIKALLWSFRFLPFEIDVLALP